MQQRKSLPLFLANNIRLQAFKDSIGSKKSVTIEDLALAKHRDVDGRPKIEKKTTTTNFRLFKEIEKFQKSEKKENEKGCSCNNILVVDDEHINHLSIKAMLKNYTFNIMTANDGLAALKLVEEHLYKC